VIVRVALLVVPPGRGGGAGVNVSGIVQLWPGWILPKPKKLQGMMLAYWEFDGFCCCGAKAKSFEFVPVILSPEMLRTSFPVFVTRTLKTKLCVLIVWPGKMSGVGGVWDGTSETWAAVAELLRFTVSVCVGPPIL
jgi:hypothetical protein